MTMSNIEEHEIKVDPNRDLDIDVFLPGGDRLVVQYRAETGLIDVGVTSPVSVDMILSSGTPDATFNEWQQLTFQAVEREFNPGPKKVKARLLRG